jgi:ribonuclease T1
MVKMILKQVVDKVRDKVWVKVCLALVSLFILGGAIARESRSDDTVAFRDLPRAAQETVRLIREGGPFPYPRDGAVFANHEGVLPKQKRGYYHEFTVKTPGARNRGARRIVVGGALAAPSEFYYTDNHYVTFRRIDE